MAMINPSFTPSTASWRARIVFPLLASEARALPAIGNNVPRLSPGLSVTATGFRAFAAQLHTLGQGVDEQFDLVVAC